MKAFIETRLQGMPAAAPRWLLAAGLLAGAALAAYGLVAGRRGAGLPDGVVARVNGHVITRDAWLRAVAAVASERRTPLTDPDQRRILDRLIDEELLVQHGVALGLVDSDPRLRSTLVSEVMLAAGAGRNAGVDDATLRQFYRDHREFFTPAARLRVAAWFVDDAGARREFQPPVPDLMLPPAKLQSYLGPSLTAAALQLATGESSEPLASGDRRAVVQVLERQPATPPPFEQVRDEVRRELRRRAEEAAVRALLVQLRDANDVIVRPDLP